MTETISYELIRRYQWYIKSETFVSVNTIADAKWSLQTFIDFVISVINEHIFMSIFVGRLIIYCSNLFIDFMAAMLA